MIGLKIVIIALIFNLLDMVSGLIGAWRTKSIMSSKLRDGLFKKVGFIFCYVISYLVDYFGADLGFNIGVSTLPILVLYVVITELTSIAENVHKINPDILPEKLLKMLQLEEKDKQ